MKVKKDIIAANALRNEVIEVLRDGPFNVDHITPFSYTGTEIDIESDEHLEIDGREYLRESGTAHGEHAMTHAYLVEEG